MQITQRQTPQRRKLAAETTKPAPKGRALNSRFHPFFGQVLVLAVTGETRRPCALRAVRSAAQGRFSLKPPETAFTHDRLSLQWQLFGTFPVMAVSSRSAPGVAQYSAFCFPRFYSAKRRGSSFSFLNCYGTVILSPYKWTEKMSPWREETFSCPRRKREGSM